MDSSDNGGPAFPCEFVKHASGKVGNNVPIMEKSEGMSLRDYLAIHASESDVLQAINWYDVYSSPTPEQRAAARYRYADTMLAARGNSHD